MSGRFFILCHECSAKIDPDEIENVFWALFGPQGLTDEDAILVCVRWAERHRLLGRSSQPYACDGCGKLVAVAPSSQWFVEQHKAERV